MNKSSIKHSLLLLLLLNSQFVLSQGAWDIAYLPVDSISAKDIGKEVRLDLKTSFSDRRLNSVRSYLSKNDTGYFLINNSGIELREDWKIYVDHGVCSEQFLVSIKEISPGIKLYLGKSLIKEIREDSILVSSDIEFRKADKKKSLVTERKTEGFWIQRNKLDGFLYKRD